MFRGLIVCAGVVTAATALQLPSATASTTSAAADDAATNSVNGAATASAATSSAGAAAVSAAVASAASAPCRALAQGRTRYRVGAAKHVLFAVADRYGATQVSITECAKKGRSWQRVLVSKGWTARNGFAKPGAKREGDGTAPTGAYTLTEAFGERNPGTKLPYRTLRKTGDCWGSTIGSPLYNRYYAGKCGSADEDLSATMASGPYKEAVVINYNRPPDSRIVQGNGSAIFLHISMNRPTAGCISLPRPALETAMRSFRPYDRIVMGTSQAVFR
ncbi:hypothetical protein J4573_14030 [Actinomadura barringtoniae]|uniref:L,D-TPase catalytic domain-containing protein n=1 Tax=Actinomadura barringtoniae TaxID=1427535 RepID=A0A939PDR9_9ACTN|nr:L,D-transpeptidase family protein [Actinomadura barringtoniae]MBO2448218.1 hypothetical protein [Actinomadura barringtoniae]